MCGMLKKYNNFFKNISTRTPDGQSFIHLFYERVHVLLGS